MEKDLQAIDAAIREAAAQMGLLAQRHVTRRELEAAISAANTADWSACGIIAHEDRLAHWDEESQTGTVQRTLTLRPAPQNVAITTTYRFAGDSAPLDDGVGEPR